MQVTITILRAVLLRSLGAASTLLAATWMLSAPALADMDNYWMRDTFKTERSTTYTAALSDDDEPAPPRRRAATRSVPEREVAKAERSIRSERAERSERSSSRRASRERNVRVASLGDVTAPAKPRAERSISGGGGVRWVANAGCLDSSLRGVIAQVASQFGSVTVNSTCRSKSHNARVGGASRSMHLTGDAADFRVNGNWGAAASYIRGLVGGFKHYGGGLFHIDTGPRRTW